MLATRTNQSWRRSTSDRIDVALTRPDVPIPAQVAPACLALPAANVPVGRLHSRQPTGLTSSMLKSVYYASSQLEKSGMVKSVSPHNHADLANKFYKKSVTLTNSTHVLVYPLERHLRTCWSSCSETFEQYLLAIF